MAARSEPPSTDVERLQDYLINWNAGPLGVVLRPDLGTDMPPVVAQLLPQPSVLKLAGVREGDLLISLNGKKTTRLGYDKVVRLLFQERLPMVLHFRSPLLQERPRGNSRTVADEPLRVRTRTSSLVRPETTLPHRPRGRSAVQEVAPHRQWNAHHVSLARDDVGVTPSPPPTTTTTKRTKRKPHGVKAHAEAKRLRKQYSVVWERGSLGISFRAYNSKVNVPCVDFISASRGLGRGMDLVCVNDVLIAINGEKTKALGVEKVLRWLHVVEKPVVLRFHASSNRVGDVLPQVTTARDDRVPRRRRLTTMLGPTQPEFEPMPRPPRRNNSVDPSLQRMDRGVLDDRDTKRQPAVLRRYAKERGTYADKEQSEEGEVPYQVGASNIGGNERRYTTNSTQVYARGRGPSYGDGVAVDCRREPTDADARQFALRNEEHIMPHRRQQHTEEAISRPDQAQLLPVRLRTNSAARDDLRRQQQLESKSVQPQGTAAPARPRGASRDSQVSNTSQLSFEEAAGVVARATGKPVEECEFGGVPVLDIKEGSVQSKLMYIYAKACLAKEGNVDDKSALKESQPTRSPDNSSFGRKPCSTYLSYTIFQDDAVALNHAPGPGNGSESMVNPEEEQKAIVGNNSIEPKTAGVSNHRLDETFAKMQNDISIQPPSVATPPLSSVVSSSSVSSDTTSNVLPAPAPIAENFISLKDFVVKGGNLTERCSHDTTTMPVQSTDGGSESDKMQEQEENLVAINSTDTDAIVEGTSEDSGEAVEEETKPNEPEESSYGDSIRADPITDENQQAKKLEKMVVLEEERLNSNEHEHEHEHEHADDDKDAEVQTTHEDDGVSGIDSSNERELAASVASLDDLLDFSAENGNDDEVEHDEFADGDGDEKKNMQISADDKDCMITSSNVKLGFVQEKEVSVTDVLEVQQLDEEHEDDKGNEDIDEHRDFEDGALSNPLLNERFRNNPDVRKVIEDKSALVVLVKESMMDEIQGILQSLQMESHFERHSTTAVGSSASPLHISQQDWDTEGQYCYRCGATGELAELNVASEQNELYCQECWELFFFSEDCQSPVTNASKTLAPSEINRLIADEDALDEALKYSFHDSSVTCEDMIHPWRYLQGSSDSTSSSIRDSNASSITDRTDEVWL